MNNHYFFRTVEFLIATLFFLGLPQENASAQAKSQTYGYVLNSGKVSMYTVKSSMWSATKHKNHSTQTIYFKHGELTHRGVRYIGLQRQAVTWTFTNGQAKPKQRKTVYVRQRSVKRVKAVLTQAKVKRTPVTLKSNRYNFWNQPRGTQQKVREQHRGFNYRFRTLYVTEKMQTRLHGTFMKVVTPTGKKLGWIYAGALTAGKYEDPIAFLTHGSKLTKNVWVNPKKPRIKVAALSQDNELKTLIVQGENNEATVINVNTIHDTYFVLRSNRTQSTLRYTSDKMYNENFYKYGYIGIKDNRVIFLKFFFEDCTHGSEITVNLQGQLHQDF